MPLRVTDRTVAETIAGWRSGDDGTTNPAGPMYLSSHAEYDLALAGGGRTNTQTTYSTCLSPGMCCW